MYQALPSPFLISFVQATRGEPIVSAINAYPRWLKGPVLIIKVPLWWMLIS